MRFALSLIFIALALAGCSNDAADSSANSANAANSAEESFDCVPDAQTWQTEVAPVIEKHCGTCHGETPDYGAPNSLVSYDSILASRGEFRDVDSIAARVANGTMPPIGMAAIPDAEAKKVVDWASCGKIDVEPNTRLTVSRPVALAPPEAPADWEFVDLTAPEFAVGEDVVDLYQCFTFESPFDEDRFIRRIQVVEDESAVLHHAVFLRDPDQNAPREPHECIGMPSGSQYLYAWAPGAGAVQFPDGGMRIKPGERFVLQIHYNNGAGLSGIEDSSGVRLYHGPPEGAEYGMTAPGPIKFEVPGRTVQEVKGTCTIGEERTIFAGMPHMHELGKEFYQSITRANGDIEELVSVTHWDFETQLFYSMPVALGPGDVIETTCVFDNPDIGMVASGPRTMDEMCFNFMYVSPPPTERYCDEFEESTVNDVAYTPGQCAPENALDAPDLVRGAFIVDTAPALAGGEIPEGVYEMTDIQIWRESADTPVGPIDLEASQILAKGQFVYEGGEFTFDAGIVSNIVLESGQAFEQNNDISLRAERDQTATDVLTGAAVCGGDGAGEMGFEVEGDTVTLGIQASAFGVEFESRYTFVKR